MLDVEFMMNTRVQNDGGSNFLLGLITGGVIGASLAIAFAPRLAKELRQRVTAAANDFSDSASKSYRDASARVADAADRVVDAVDGVTARGQAVRDDMADAVGRGAREVEKFAMASKSDSRRS
jgi:gas vesicle protein